MALDGGFGEFRMSEHSSDSDSEESSRRFLENILVHKRQDMIIRLQEAERELEPELPPDQRVYIIGKPGASDRGKSTAQPLLSVRSSWLRVHNKKWILGTTLLNTSPSATVTLDEQSLRTGPWLAVNASLHCLSWVEGDAGAAAGPTRAKRARVPGAWRTLRKLPPGALLHALTVLDVDLAWPDTVRVEQLFQFSSSGVEDSITTAHDLTALGSKDPALRVFPLEAACPASPSSSLGGSLQDLTSTPMDFTPRQTDSTPAQVDPTPAQLDFAPDLLSVQVTSVPMELEVRLPETENLRRLLTKAAGFETAARAAPRSFLIHRGARHPLLKGVLLIVKRQPLDREAYRMTAYSRDKPQAERVLRVLIELPAVTVNAAAPTPESQLTGEQALRQEQRFVQRQLGRMLRGPDITERDFRRFRTRLSELELATDKLAFGGAEKESRLEDVT